MPEQVVAPALPQGREGRPLRLGQQQLQVGDLRVAAAHMQRGVVPGELPQGDAAAAALGGLPQQPAAQLRQPGLEHRQGIRGRQQQQAMGAAVGRRATLRPGQLGRHRPLQRTERLQQQRRGRQLLRRCQSCIPVGELQHQLLPGHRRGTGHRQRREDAVAAVAVVQRLGGAGIQPQLARIGLHGYQLQAEQMPGVAQEAPAQGADAAGAAGQEASQGGAAHGARQQSWLAAVQQQLLFQIRQQQAGLGTEHAAGLIELQQPVQAAAVQHQPSGQGNALAVISRARSTQGEADAVACAGRGDRRHLLAPLGAHADLGPQTLQQRLQHR